MKHQTLLKLAAGALLLVAASAQAQQQAYTASDTELFSGPDDDYPLLADVDAGYPIYVFGCTGGYTWCDVGFDNFRGWIDGRDIEFPYGEQRIAVFDYGPRFRLPIISFSIGAYWGRWYNDRPFYADRPRWERHPAPPVYWNAPRRDWHEWRQEGGHDRGYDRGDHRDDHRDHDNDRVNNQGNDRDHGGDRGQPVNGDRRNFEAQLERQRQQQDQQQRQQQDQQRQQRDQQQRDQQQRQQQDQQRQQRDQQQRQQQEQQRQQQDQQRQQQDQQRQQQQRQQQDQQRQQQQRQQQDQQRQQQQQPRGDQREHDDGPRGDGDGRDRSRQ